MLETSNAWENFLISQGARSVASKQAAELDFGLVKTSPGQGFISPLTHLGVLAAVGEDAANFLHNQLTNDVLGLEETGARLAGYCSPKGRLLATMLVWKTEETIYLAMPRSLLAAVQKRLQMDRSEYRLHSWLLQVRGSGLPGGIRPMLQRQLHPSLKSS